jgi:hypothetical protein
MRRRDGLCSKRVKNGESVSLLLLLAVRRMRREHTRRMSKDADDACQLEVLWTFHHCFLDILAACFLKRCVNLITGRFCLSSVVSSVHSTSHNRPFLATHGSAFLGPERTASARTRFLLTNLKTHLIIRISKYHPVDGKCETKGRDDENRLCTCLQTRAKRGASN